MSKEKLRESLKVVLAGVAGIEPTMKESKSFALPLGYTPFKKKIYMLIFKNK